ncbi:MAG: PIN domain-containing protein [Bryobacteraceae bacterium]|nr:PIN domain-containing protein [Bryobacteraceae bacterium]
MAIFIDTSAFLAVVNGTDDFHEEATPVWDKLLDAGEELVSTSIVLIETVALLQALAGLRPVRRFREVAQPLVAWQPIDVAAIDQAIWDTIGRDRRWLGVVDISSFNAMRKLGIATAFTFDKHFSEEGFEVVPKPRPTKRR